MERETINPSDNKRNTFKKILYIFIIFNVGCAPLTVQEVRDKSPKTFTFKMDEGYKSVYQKILSEAQWRYGVKLNVQGNLYTDNKSGTVAITTPIDLLGTAGVLMTIDVKASAEKRSKIKVYYGVWTWKEKAQKVEEWIK